MAPSRKIEYIRRKKTHNGHYCQLCHIYYQGYNHRCSSFHYRAESSTFTVSSEGRGWININPMILKPKSKSLKLKEFDSWLKLDLKGK